MFWYTLYITEYKYWMSIAKTTQTKKKCEQNEMTCILYVRKWRKVNHWKLGAREEIDTCQTFFFNKIFIKQRSADHLDTLARCSRKVIFSPRSPPPRALPPPLRAKRLRRSFDSNGNRFAWWWYWLCRRVGWARAGGIQVKCIHARTDTLRASGESLFQYGCALCVVIRDRDCQSEHCV